MAMVMCQASLKIFLLGGAPSNDLDADYPACIENGKNTAKRNFAPALRSIKKQKAQEALKSYHVAFVTAMDGIKPGTNELKISYEQRQQLLESKLNEAWARFEIEK